MAINIFRWLVGKEAPGDPYLVSCHDLDEAYKDFSARRLAFETCVNFFTRAFSLAEFETIAYGEKIKEAEYFLWNIEPNTNQNKTQFLQKIMMSLCVRNEAIVISTKHRDGHEMLVVADDWNGSKLYPQKKNEYTDVRVGDMTYNKTFTESDVIHLRMNNNNIRQVCEMLTASYDRLIQTAETAYSWANGKHLIAEVDQSDSARTTSGKAYSEAFADMANAAIMPWLKNPNGVLPQFKGWNYRFPQINGETKVAATDFKTMFDDIFDFTARAFGIPSVLILGTVADSQDSFDRWLTTSIDPLAQQFEQEIIRKRYGFDLWKDGCSVHVNTNNIKHFDLFSNATNVEKLISSGTHSINDVLEAMGASPLPDDFADVHYMTKNIDTASNIADSIES